MEMVIADLNILYGDELKVKKGESVWIKNGIFKKIASTEEMPKDLPVINASGLYMMPGLIDLHVHLMWDGSLNPVETQESEGHDQMVVRAVTNCQQYLNNGITTIRDVGSVDDIALQISQSVENGLIKGPNIVASGKTITMTGGHDPFWANFVDGKDEALKATREQIFKGAQVIKVSATGGVYGRAEGESALNSELSYEELKTICDVAHQFGLKVASHAIGREGILNSIRAGVDSIEHGHYLDEELLQMMKEKNIAWIPTLFTYKQNAFVEGIPAYTRKKAKEIVSIHESAFKEYFDYGILVGCGTDAGAPCVKHPSILEELLAMKEIVSDNKKILKTATTNAGQILGKNVGQIKEDYLADFILLNKNPLENLNNIEQINSVYKAGEPILNSLNQNL